MKTGTRMAPITAILLVACGGANGGSGSCNPGSIAAIVIKAGGVTPAAVCVLPGGSVTFTNEDTAAHDIQSGAACPQLNLGPIPAGESRMATFPTVATCSFRDELQPTNAAFQGLVSVTTGPVQGPGY